MIKWLKSRDNILEAAFFEGLTLWGKIKLNNLNSYAKNCIVGGGGKLNGKYMLSGS